MEEKLISKTLEIDKPSEKKEGYIPPKQSANTLFRFVEQLDFLLESIECEAIFPRYSCEAVDYLKIHIDQIAYPMVCFCDINLHKIDSHIKIYGEYGIAFSKQWGINNGIQPIQYINPNSILCKDFSSAFNLAIESKEESPAQNYLLSHMLYLKPIEGKMERNKKEQFKNFTDECEWRFIPNVIDEELPQAITDSDIFSLPRFNKALRVAKKCWLKFDLKDVKYIIIKNEQEFKKLVELINKKSISFEEKSKLISKILIWENVEGDF